MAIFSRIRTGQDIVNGLVTLRPRDDGRVDSSDGSGAGVSYTRAQHVGTGADPVLTNWVTLNGRYKSPPTGWNE